jgi:hypothetical protein
VRAAASAKVYELRVHITNAIARSVAITLIAAEASRVITNMFFGIKFLNNSDNEISVAYSLSHFERKTVERYGCSFIK